MIMNSNLKFIIYSYKVNELINIHKKHPIKLIWMLFNVICIGMSGMKAPLIEIILLLCIKPSLLFHNYLFLRPAVALYEISPRYYLYQLQLYSLVC